MDIKKSIFTQIAVNQIRDQPVFENHRTENVISDVVIRQGEGNSGSKQINVEARLLKKTPEILAEDAASKSRTIQTLDNNLLIYQKNRTACKHMFQANGKIVGPRDLMDPMNKQFKERKVQIEWLLQVARSTKSKGTGLAASRMSESLKEISQDDGMVSSLAKNSTCDVPLAKKILNDLSGHISQLDELRDKLTSVLKLSTKIGGEKKVPEIIDVYTGHVADNIVQKLTKDGAVLIPVDFHVTAPEYPGGGGGHRSVVFLEKIAGSLSCNLHYFETDGPVGGKYSLASVRGAMGSSLVPWTEKRMSPDLLKNKQEEQSKPGDPSLRFSEFQISNISIEKIDSIFISRLLARSSSVYPNATTQSQLDEAISKERKLILESIFSHLSALGKMKIPEQIMQYSQRGGECEQASLVSFRNFYIGRSDVRNARGCPETQILAKHATEIVEMKDAAVLQ